MKPILITVAYAPTDLPTGVTSGALRVSLTKADGSPAVDASGAAIAPITGADETEFSFAGVPSGSYIATVQRLDSNGAVLGAAAVSTATEIVQPSFSAPVSVTVHLG